jgi:MFS family permease
MTATAALQGPRYMRYLLFIAGMGGLLYGIDIGIIAGALPYLESTAVAAWKLSAQQLSFIVAAVLLGSVLSSLFAGMLADAFGRKPAMLLAGALFTLSIPVIALADGYGPLLLGRLLQGISGGLIGVVVPLYLAECLSAERRGRGTAMFQLLLTLGLVVAALIGLVQARSVEAASNAALAAGGDIAQALFAARDQAWRRIFWMSLAPGLVFTLGGLLLTESPRWLLRRGRADAALAALSRSLPLTDAREALAAMEGTSVVAATEREPLLSRRYVLPFVLACLVLACTQASGINSVLSYAVTILNAAGLPGSMANGADVAIKLLNAGVTVLAVGLVDRKGRKFLLMLGSGGMTLALLSAALLFQSSESDLRDVSPALQARQQGDDLTLTLDAPAWRYLGVDAAAAPQMLTVAWSYGEFSNVQTLRSDAAPGGATTLKIRRADTVQPDNIVGALFRRLHLNPFADPAASALAPLHIDSARVGPVPRAAHGGWTAACILAFVAFFAVGPGVCVWLALSELMPTRIRSNGMSIALLINQFVSTSIAAVFLPTVGRHGYAAMFFFWAACTLVFFLVAARLLPETKGRTLEQIEASFARGRSRAA